MTFIFPSNHGRKELFVEEFEDSQPLSSLFTTASEQFTTESNTSEYRLYYRSNDELFSIDPNRPTDEPLRMSNLKDGDTLVWSQRISDSVLDLTKDLIDQDSVLADPERRVDFFFGLLDTLSNVNKVDLSRFKNRKRLKEKLEGDKWDECVGELLKRIIKSMVPDFNKVGNKSFLPFSKFCEKIQFFYLLKDMNRDGKHFFRGSTQPYRTKHSITSNTKWGDIRGEDKPFGNRALLLDLGIPAEQLDDENDGVQVDHILSCQVFQAICEYFEKRGLRDYTYDYFCTWKVWLNRCWNFQALPKKANRTKGSIEKEVIKVLKEGGEIKGGIVEKYFNNVRWALENYGKQDSLDQSKDLKRRLKGFLGGFWPENRKYKCLEGYFFFNYYS